jgi:hypothetical protein
VAQLGSSGLHEAQVEAPGRTWGVWGCRCHARHNNSLWGSYKRRRVEFGDCENRKTGPEYTEVNIGRGGAEAGNVG